VGEDDQHGAEGDRRAGQRPDAAAGDERAAEQRADDPGDAVADEDGGRHA
jgi:hypothetical protein